MDIDLSLPSGEHDKDVEEPTAIDNMLDGDEKLHNGDLMTASMVDIGDEVQAEDGGDLNSPMTNAVVFKEDTNLEPLSGMEFESHGEAYSFYQEYARSMGFNTAIQNSRRSKTSREFIDAKFACSRYGTKREYDKSFNRPRARQTKQDPENATGRRSCSKTDCKASMHVKRRPDGKWVIHSFIKEHNHELLPAQAVSEQTRKMYEEEAKADSDTWNKQPTLRSPSPFEKSVSGLYTNAVFKRFQVEVVGAVACHPKKERQDETEIVFREAFGNCTSVNNSSKSLAEAGPSAAHGLLCIEEDVQSKSIGKITNKKRTPAKKRKVSFEPDVIAVGSQDSLQQMEKLNPRAVTLDGYYSAQPSVPGMIQLNLMAPTRDNYYGSQQTIQGLGQLNSIAPSHDGYYSAQQSIHGLGQMDFFRAPAGFTYGIRDDPNVRTASLHDDASRHG
ncbi:hypothetical protein TIFTF001_001608 [Ficus carica]|uniref:FAR1 domain-containing protein n=1 Tax=Ficus carica TaxID=3494 RepID=A0AA87Z9U8_FICCA|nr:hypothetical protein TIFTF001_001608 [Ficus carica]